ncbi:MAG TPA: hypothetical protein VM621_08610 [Luteibacter sp.]|uniref:hypothetical protein n=1 Tax=Luteibacter sp. TaxID=1886636 RepID=UPI002BF431B8|nr:hypothetical protein [Luteibacter sp.]HVI55099.1 hypothetical protein [Luteibacter sp.]
MSGIQNQTPRVVIVTGADEAFAIRLRGWGSEICAAARPRGYDVACFDLGLSEATREALRSLGVQLIEPAWDFDVSESIRLNEAYLRVLTVRPHLRRYLPGYDIYVWIDTDVHVQHAVAIDWLVAGARGCGMALVPQVHFSYAQTEASTHWRYDRMYRYFGSTSARRTLWQTYYNAGVFALTADAPHWEAWRARFGDGIHATQGALICDQSALNEAIHTDGLVVSSLPAICNWLCHLSPPLRHRITGRFLEPGPAGQEIALMHMTSDTKRQASFAEFWS